MDREDKSLKERPSGPSLILVYNADSGFLNAIADFVHKNVSPSTYQCNLCALTYDNRGMKGEWKDFIDDIDLDIQFLHRDELYEKYGLESVDLPAGFIKMGSNMELLIPSYEINGCSTLDELEELIRNKLNQL